MVDVCKMGRLKANSLRPFFFSCLKQTFFPYITLSRKKITLGFGTDFLLFKQRKLKNEIGLKCFVLRCIARIVLPHSDAVVVLALYDVLIFETKKIAIIFFTAEKCVKLRRNK